MNIAEGQVRIDPDDNEKILICSVKGDHCAYKVLRSSDRIPGRAGQTFRGMYSETVSGYFSVIDESWLVEQLLKEYGRA